MPVDDIQDTRWHDGDTCPHCGAPTATNGKDRWCTNVVCPEGGTL